MARVTQALAVALLAAAAAQAQISQIVVPDYHLVERSAGLWSQPVTIQLVSGPPPLSNVTVDWALISGSATAGSDFVMASGTLTFTALIDSAKTINVQINGDTLDEWTLPLTYHQDEVFFVQLSNPSANATIQKGRATITLLDDDRPMPGLQFLAAAAGGNSTAGQNKLLWRVPAAATQPNDILIRWNTGPGCAPPATTGAALSGADAGQGFFVANFGYTMGGAGALQSWAHPGRLLNTQYCYSLFTYYGATPTAEPMTVKATPFDATPPGREAWRYSPGCYLPCATAMLAPPSVGFDAIYMVDNSGVVHAMDRGPSGGAWPASWNPLSLGKPTQSRSAVVPTKVVPTLGDWRLFVGTDGGGVHAVDGKSGQLIWSRSAAFGTALPTNLGAQAAPAGIFRNFGGYNDMILVGTNADAPNNRFFALNPATGGDLATYSDPNLGNVAGMAAVEYPPGNRVFALTASGTVTLIALDLGPTGSPSLTPSTLPWNPLGLGGSGSANAPVWRQDRVYFGRSSPQIHVLQMDGTLDGRGTGDGSVKGFVWPDRRNNNLYFSCDTSVEAWEDVGGSLNQLWWVPVGSPSMVLQKPGTDFVYVGDGNGRLLQIDVVTQAVTPLLLEGPGVQIGAPSLDGANNLILVGSMTGTIHAVRVDVPF